MMFLLFGRITTRSAGHASTAASRSAVDGFIVCPPVTTRWTPRLWKMRRTPSPTETATTAVWTGSVACGGSSTDPPPAAPSRTQRSSSTWSSRSVTRIFRGRPTSTAASMAAPMSSVWMWQFQIPSPPTTTIESPTPAQTSLNAGIVSSGASRKYMTS